MRCCSSTLYKLLMHQTLTLLLYHIHSVCNIAADMLYIPTFNYNINIIIKDGRVLLNISLLLFNRWYRNYTETLFSILFYNVHTLNSCNSLLWKCFPVISTKQNQSKNKYYLQQLVGITIRHNNLLILVVCLVKFWRFAMHILLVLDFS